MTITNQVLSLETQSHNYPRMEANCMPRIDHSARLMSYSQISNFDQGQLVACNQDQRMLSICLRRVTAKSYSLLMLGHPLNLVGFGGIKPCKRASSSKASKHAATKSTSTDFEDVFCTLAIFNPVHNYRYVPDKKVDKDSPHNVTNLENPWWTRLTLQPSPAPPTVLRYPGSLFI